MSGSILPSKIDPNFSRKDAFVTTKAMVANMSTKELLYIDDALGHAQYMMTQCRETAEKLTDGELKSYVEQMAAKQQQIFSSLYGLL